ncbi:MAG: hypothetical protein NZR01_09035 [Bryobacteraceae bacterium]|nr:hypothetical protein [Bryobacteraceae bacterium]
MDEAMEEMWQELRCKATDLIRRLPRVQQLLEHMEGLSLQRQQAEQRAMQTLSERQRRRESCQAAEIEQQILALMQERREFDTGVRDLRRHVCRILKRLDPDDPISRQMGSLLLAKGGIICFEEFQDELECLVKISGKRLTSMTGYGKDSGFNGAESVASLETEPHREHRKRGRPRKWADQDKLRWLEMSSDKKKLIEIASEMYPDQRLSNTIMHRVHANLSRWRKMFGG